MKLQTKYTKFFIPMNKNSISEITLVCMTYTPEEKLNRAFYCEHRYRIRNYVLHYMTGINVRTDAESVEDIQQNVYKYMVQYKIVEKYDPSRAPLSTLLYINCKTQVIKHLQKTAAQNRLVGSRPAWCAPPRAWSHGYNALDARIDLKAFCGGLDDRIKTLLRLYVEGYTWEEIASQTNVHIKTIEYQLSRLRAHAKKYFKLKEIA